MHHAKKVCYDYVWSEWNEIENRSTGWFEDIPCGNKRIDASPTLQGYIFFYLPNVEDYVMLT